MGGIPEPNPNSTDSSVSNGGKNIDNNYVERKDYGYRCFHQGCPETFSNDADLKLHILKTAPTILAEMNVMKANILELTGIIKRWQKSSDVERATYLHYANLIERATLEFSIADVAAIDIIGTHGDSNDSAELACSRAEDVHTSQSKISKRKEGNTNEREQVNTWQHFQPNILDPHLERQQPEQQQQQRSRQSSISWELSEDVLIVDDDEKDKIEDGLDFKRGRYDISCGWPDLESAFFGK